MVNPRAAARMLAVVAGASLVAGACGRAHYDDALNPPLIRQSDEAFAVDPALLATTPIVTNSALAGMRGVAPALSISDEFRAQVLAADPGVQELSGAAEGYDAVVLSALAAELARDDVPARIADRMIEITKVGKQCTDYRGCRHLIQTHIEIDYFGKSGGIQMQPNGDPAEAGFGTIEFAATGLLRTGPISPAQAPLSLAPVPLIDVNAPPVGDGTLRLGFLLPPAGPEGDVARAAQAGARAAVTEINAAGGVLGAPVEVVDDAAGDGSPAAVNTAVDQLVARYVDVVIGGTTFDIDTVAVPRLTGVGIMVFSPTDDSRAMSILADRGLFFRLAPPEDLEGQVLGTLVANDGYTWAAVVTSGSANELDTSNDVSAALSGAGGKVVATVTATGNDSAAAAAAAQAVVDSDAQSVVITAPANVAAPVIKALVERGKGPTSFGIYGTTDNMTQELVTLVGEK